MPTTVRVVAGQPVEESPGLIELAPPGTLRQVPRDDDQIGPDAGDVGQQRVGELLPVGSEMDVRQVDDDRHVCTIACGSPRQTVEPP